MHRFFIMAVVLFITMTTAVAQNRNMSVEKVFEAASQIEGFQEVENVYEYFKVPKNLGKPTMIIGCQLDGRFTAPYCAGLSQTTSGWVNGI